MFLCGFCWSNLLSGFSRHNLILWWCVSCFRKPMIWNEEKDELLCREILVVNVFCGTKRSTVARGAKWEKVAENLNKLQDVYFKVDKRAVRDRYNNLARDLRKKIKNEEKASGIETEMTNLEKALGDLIEIEDATESEQRVLDDQKRQGRENATDMRTEQPTTQLESVSFVDAISTIEWLMQQSFNWPFGDYPHSYNDSKILLLDYFCKWCKKYFIESRTEYRLPKRNEGVRDSFD